MLNKGVIVPLLRKSLALKDPAIVTDVAYKYTDDELWDIICNQTVALSPSYTYLNIPDSETPLILVLAKKEVFLQLSAATAPFYPLEVDGGSLRKDKRFDHYIRLIEVCNQDYLLLISDPKRATIEQSTVLIKGKHFSREVYNSSKAPTVELTASGITSNSVNLDWTAFSVVGGMFYKYNLYKSIVGTIIDEYSESILSDADKYIVASFTDIHKCRYRLTNISPNTVVNIAVVSLDTNGLFGFSEIQVTTLEG